MGERVLLRRLIATLLAALAALALVVPGAAAMAADHMLVIGHRGAAGERPEHTLEGYERAIDEGADYIEPDLVVTKDLVLVARHENEIGGTTDVADHPEFADRRRSKEVDGRLVSGWFAEDFTLAELRTLRAKERIPGVRPANARFDGLYQIPTFAEIVKLVKAKEAETGRTIGIYPELKHPTFLLQTDGIDSVDLLVTALKKAGLDHEGAPVFIQCFEVGPLKRLHKLVPLPLVQLIEAQGGPADEPGVTYASMLSDAGLKDIAQYASVIGVDMRLLFTPDGKPTDLIARAYAAGLKVHAWTLRKENAFLPPMLRRGSNPNGTGDFAAAFAALRKAGVDGVFTDDPGAVPKQEMTSKTAGD